MLIDWFTVIAQIVNFLILVFLLKRFLYGPIIAAMDKREARIAGQLEAAERKRREAEVEKTAYQQKNQEMAEKREALLQQAREDVQTKRHELMRKARQEVEEVQARWHRAIQQEKEAFLQDLRQRAGRQIYQIVRQALADLANADLEQRLIDVFIKRLRDLDGNEREAISASIGQSDQELVIASAFELPPEARQKIMDATRHALADGHVVRFETAPELISGIELKAPGYKIAWSLADYLDSLEENLTEALRERIET